MKGYEIAKIVIAVWAFGLIGALSLALMDKVNINSDAFNYYFGVSILVASASCFGLFLYDVYTEWRNKE